MTIPRGSGNTKAIQGYVKDFGKQLNYETVQDEIGNIIIRKPAYPGKESVPSVCVQCHLDMVCEHDPELDIDMTKEPIKPRLVLDGEFGPKLMAQGTTLGADDGIGVASALALLEDKEIQHGPLEVLFTIDEEVGMVGARALKPGFIKSEYYVNIDSEEDWRITIGCAGAFDVEHTLPLEAAPQEAGTKAFSLLITKCLSGHSGAEIHIGRMNPIKALFRILRRVEEEGIEFRIADVNGGTKRNVIPAEAGATLVVKEAELAKAKEIVQNEWSLLEQEYKILEPNAILVVKDETVPQSLLTVASTRKLVLVALTSPHGVLRRSPINPEMIETSINFFNVHLVSADGSISAFLGFFARSTSNSQLDALGRFLRARAEMTGCSTGPDHNKYAAWQPDDTNALFLACKEAHIAAREQLNAEALKKWEEGGKNAADKPELLETQPEIYIVHAGLECGILLGLFPYLKCISIGPYVTSPHTVNESLHLRSIAPYWRTLVLLLEKMH